MRQYDFLCTFSNLFITICIRIFFLYHWTKINIPVKQWKNKPSNKCNVIMLPTNFSYQRHKTTFAILLVFISKKKIDDKINTFKMLHVPRKPWIFFWNRVLTLYHGAIWATINYLHSYIIVHAIYISLLKNWHPLLL